MKKIGGKVEGGCAKVISSSDLDTTKTFMWFKRKMQRILWI